VKIIATSLGAAVNHSAGIAG